jgi:ATP-dependent RNA helicase DeaD
MNSFEQLGVQRPEFLKALESLGFTSATPIQEKVIPVLLENKTDVIALAQTGTGKTLAFGLPLLHTIDPTKNQIQGIVLAPTRELCVQIKDDLIRYAQNLPALKILPVYGGASIDKQISELRRGVHLVVATPGRLLDLLRRNSCDLSNIKIFVLDEADEMLNMGFQEDIEAIFNTTPKEKNVWLFSATMPTEVRNLSKRYMSDYMELAVSKKQSTAENISHVAYVVHARDKYLALKRILDMAPEIFGIIFCRTKIETQEIAEQLVKEGYDADSLHGDLSQVQRDKVMARFRNRSLQVLVCTDIAARGIDVDDVTHVIHYGLPDELESYTHRSGRTARAGKSGVSIALLHSKEIFKLRQLEKSLSITFARNRVPQGYEVCEKQLFHFVEKMKNVEVNTEEIERYLKDIFVDLESLTREDIITRFVSLEFDRFLTYYRNAPDLNPDIQNETSRKHRQGVESGVTQTMTIDIGAEHGITKKQLIFIIKDLIPRFAVIGDITVKKSSSVAEIQCSRPIFLSREKIYFENKSIPVSLSEATQSTQSEDGYRGGGGGSRSGGSRGGYASRTKFTGRSSSSRGEGGYGARISSGDYSNSSSRRSSSDSKSYGSSSSDRRPRRK